MAESNEQRMLTVMRKGGVRVECGCGYWSDTEEYGRAIRLARFHRRDCAQWKQQVKPR
jgi:hypothetical protein